MTLYYLGGVIGVVVLVGLLFHWLIPHRSKPALGTRRERTRQINVRPAREKAVQAELHRSRNEAAEVDAELGEAKQTAAHHDPQGGSLLVILGFAGLLLIYWQIEAVVFYLLSAQSGFMEIAPETWAALAPPLALIGVFMMHTLLGAMVVDPLRPRLTIRRAKIGTVIFGCGIVLGMWLVLAGRGLTDPASVEQLTSIGLMTLAALSSIAGAFASTVATTLWEDQEPQRAVRHFGETSRAYTRHIEALERDLEALKASAPDPGAAGPATERDPAGAPANVRVPPLPGGSVNGSAGPASVMALALLLGLPALVGAQPVTVADARGTTPTRNVFAKSREGACEIVVDVTTSADRSALANAVDLVRTQLETIVDTRQCTLLRIVPFAGSLLVALYEEPIVSMTALRTACEQENAARKPSPWEVTYPKQAADARRKDVEKCVISGAAKRQQAIARSADRLKSVLDLPARGPCTALHQAIQRSMMRARKSIVITDAIQSCALPRPSASVPADAHVLFLIVPPADDTGDVNKLLDRMERLERAFPNADVVLSTEVTPIALGQGLSQ